MQKSRNPQYTSLKEVPSAPGDVNLKNQIVLIPPRENTASSKKTQVSAVNEVLKWHKKPPNKVKYVLLGWWIFHRNMLKKQWNSLAPCRGSVSGPLYAWYWTYWSVNRENWNVSETFFSNSNHTFKSVLPAGTFPTPLSAPFAPMKSATTAWSGGIAFHGCA